MSKIGPSERKSIKAENRKLFGAYILHPVDRQMKGMKNQATILLKLITSCDVQTPLALYLSKRTLRIGWAVILFFHSFNALYSCGLAYLYVYMARPEMEYYASLVQMMPQEHYIGLVLLYAAISALNVYCATEMILVSLCRRQLAFRRRTEHRAPKVASMKSQKSFSTSSSTSRTKDRCSKMLWTSLLSALKGCVKFLRDVMHAFSVRGHLFDVALLGRELTEIGSQTYQAYYSSILVSKMWMNQLFAALIFANCFATTAVHRISHNNPGRSRLWYTLIDLFLDFAWGFILPSNIIFNYIPSYIRHYYSFPEDFFYSDTTFTRAMLECQQFFMISWADAFTTTLPYINMFLGLRNLKILLQFEIEDMQLRPSSCQIVPDTLRSGYPPDTNSSQKAKQGDSRAAEPVKQTSSLSKEERNAPKEGPVGPSVSPRRPKWFKRCTKGAGIIIPLCGSLVLLTSIVASGVFFVNTRCESGCKLRMYPWFTSDCACSVLEIDCYSRGISGNMTEMHDALSGLEPYTMRSLIVSHCPDLTMPDDIRRFHNLMALEFYNCTFHDWPESASLSLPYVPRLGYIYIIRSRMAALPEGIISDLAPNVVDIEITSSFIGSIPDDLDARWPNVRMLYIEHCGLLDIPQGIAKMELTDLSLVGNEILVFPQIIPGSKTWMYAYFDRNPMLNIFDSTESLPNLKTLSIQRTSIYDLPRFLWIQAEAQTQVDAFGTPMCDIYVYLAEGGLPFTCNVEDIYTSNGVFPLAYKDSIRNLTLSLHE